MDKKSRIVIALGGNALQESKSEATAEAQLNVVKKTSKYIADIIDSGANVVIAHGNGPQVGRIVLQNENSVSVTPAMPFDVCGAMSQGMIGYHIQQGLREELLSRQSHGKPEVVTVVTQVVVDEKDSAFSAPTKPIGPFYGKDEAEEIARTKGYFMKEDAGRGYRRVVASPNPVEIVELNAVKSLMEAGFIVVTVGGGGIPVFKDEAGRLSGAAAVIDKDLAACKLASDIDADYLLILTAVECAYINFGKENQTALEDITVDEAKAYMSEGQFASGSMLPKIDAACRFAQSKKGRKAIITSLDKAALALEGNAGTTVHA